jgi:hypothetical protein
MKDKKRSPNLPTLGDPNQTGTYLKRTTESREREEQFELRVLLLDELYLSTVSVLYNY